MKIYLVTWGVRTTRVRAKNNAEARKAAVALWNIPGHLRNRISAVAYGTKS